MSGKPAARQGDMTQYGGSIVQGSAGVRIGAPTGVACSVCPGGVTSGHPVNPLLGAKVLPGETDIALPGPLPFILSRTYSSYRTKTPAPVGSLGPGWKMPADIRLQLRDNTLTEHDSYAISEKSHGREEIRLHIVCDVPDELIDFTFEWKGLKKLCVAVSFRSIIAEQKKEPEMTVRYYISSADLTAEKFATAIRNHWHVENKLHWRLDVVMNEDDCRIRRGNAAELFSGIRHIAINILTNDKVFKAGLRRKMRKAAMDRNYLASVLAGSGLS
ncbi:ISAs1 family transposase [Escherichia coli]|nr:ISAs1 family transposase [Escherichia coli]